MGFGPTSSQALAPKAVASLSRRGFCGGSATRGGLVSPRGRAARRLRALEGGRGPRGQAGAEARRPCFAFAARAEFGRIQGWQAVSRGAAHMSAVCVRAVAHRGSFVQPQQASRGGRTSSPAPPVPRLNGESLELGCSACAAAAEEVAHRLRPLQRGDEWWTDLHPGSLVPRLNGESLELGSSPCVAATGAGKQRALEWWTNLHPGE